MAIDAKPARTTTATPSLDAPLFAEDAVIRRVHREAIVLLGGGRALLMQVAHPKVAAGVAEHSSFRDGKRKRLLRTLKPTLSIVFGTEAQARRSAAMVNAVHADVSGDGYRADDPELLFWVLATLIDTALLMHERFLRPLSDSDADAYYRDMLRAGALLGVRREEAPPDLGSLRDYMAEALAGLEVTAEARSIAANLFSGKGPAALGGWFLRNITAGLLPHKLREAYGMPRSGLADMATKAAFKSGSVLLPRVPLAIRRTPGFLLPPKP